MKVAENPRYTADYLDPEKRSIANAVQVVFAGGEATEEVAVEYPIRPPKTARRGDTASLEQVRIEPAHTL